MITAKSSAKGNGIEEISSEITKTWWEKNMELSSSSIFPKGTTSTGKVF